MHTRVTLTNFHMTIVCSTQDPIKFAEYLAMSENTICGRHPIGILLNVRFKHLWQTWSTFLKALRVAFHMYTCRQQIIQSSERGDKLSIEFTSYAQSSQCHSISDSSVSYASAVVYET
jgi:predicted class III extradiol MEMO1 family dioxygenase